MNDTLTPEDLDYRYAKIAKFLQTSDKKLYKYKQCKKQLYSKISQNVLKDPLSISQYPSLSIVIKPPKERTNITEDMISAFFTKLYKDDDISSTIFQKFKQFRQSYSQKHLSNASSSVIVKLK